MSARQEALTVALRTAQTRSERRSAVRQFQAPEERDARAELNRELRSFLLSRVAEFRAAGETTGSAGGYLTPPGFATEVIRYAKSYAEIMADMEDLPTDNGNAWSRPQVSSFTPQAGAVAENTALSDVTSDMISFAGQQEFGRTPTYPAMMLASLQLIQDTFTETGGTTTATSPGLGQHFHDLGNDIGNVSPGWSGPSEMPLGNGDLVQILSSAAGESIGRQAASVASAALYATGTAAGSSQQIALTTVSVSAVAGMFAALDPAYLAGAKLYVSAADYATLLADDPVKLRALGVPVVPSNAVTDYTASGDDVAASGPVLANMARFYTMRRVRAVNVQVLRERWADKAEVGVNVYARIDFKPRGETTAAVFAV